MREHETFRIKPQTKSNDRLRVQMRGFLPLNCVFFLGAKVGDLTRTEIKEIITQTVIPCEMLYTGYSHIIIQNWY